MIFCDECINFPGDNGIKPFKKGWNVCKIGKKMRFKSPKDYNDDKWGFNVAGCRYFSPNVENPDSTIDHCSNSECHRLCNNKCSIEAYDICSIRI